MRRSLLFLFVLVVVVDITGGRTPFQAPSFTVRENEEFPLNLEPVIIEETESTSKLIESENEDQNEQYFEDLTPIGRISYNGNQLWKAVVDDIEKIKVLTNLRDENHISMWGGNRTAIDILVKPNSLRTVEEAFKEKQINFDVIIQDLQKAIDEENNPIQENTDRQERCCGSQRNM